MNAQSPSKTGSEEETPAATGAQQPQSRPPNSEEQPGAPQKAGVLPAVIKKVGVPEPLRPKIQPAAQKETVKPVLPPAPQSRFQRRHLYLLLSFVLCVILPTGVSAWYLWARAADQYASNVGFAVRTEEQSPSIASMLGPLQLGGSSTASDAEVLYQFIQSQSLVADIDAALDLRKIWSKADPAVDPVFAYHPPGTIEDLLEHWQRKVKVFYDSSTGLIELRTLAFTPEDAKAIAEEIYAESTKMINQLSDIAREDAVRYAREELDRAVARLKLARSALTQFRNRTQIVDPTIDVQGQAGILNTLNQQMAEALISLDMLNETTRTDDPRIEQAQRKIKVIEARIEQEKLKLGISDSTVHNEAFATLVGEYESLVVDREFAEQTYIAALASFDAAQAEARRQTRYLAAHVRPTLAQKAEYPDRPMLFALVALFAFLIWSILALVAYSIRDRR